jgi:hypothetical protein
MPSTATDVCGYYCANAERSAFLSLPDPQTGHIMQPACLAFFVATAAAAAKSSTPLFAVLEAILLKRQKLQLQDTDACLREVTKN